MKLNTDSTHFLFTLYVMIMNLALVFISMTVRLDYHCYSGKAKALQWY